MTTPDLMLGMSADQINKALGKLFQKQALKESLFKGSSAVTMSDVNFTGSWSLGKAPTVDLNPPSLDVWKQSIGPDGTAIKPISNPFLTDLQDLAVGIENAAASQNTTIGAKVICNVDTSGKDITIAAHAIVLDLSDASDMTDYFVKTIIVPKVLQSVTEMLSGFKLSPPQWGGVTLGAPAVGVLNDQIVTAYNLVGSPIPTVPASLPSKPFYVVASPMLIRTAAIHLIADKIQGKKATKSGSMSPTIPELGPLPVSAHYSASATINNAIIARPLPNHKPSELVVGIYMSLDASAGISSPAGYLLTQAAKAAAEAAAAAEKAAEEAAAAAEKAAEEAAAAAAAAAKKAAERAAEEAEHKLKHAGSSVLHSLGL